MKTFTFYVLLFLTTFLTQYVVGQEEEQETETIEMLQEMKARITQSEKEALKLEIEAINLRLEKKEISFEEAQQLKENEAKKRALNIENRIAIVDNKIALLKRNGGDLTILEKDESEIFNVKVNGKSVFSAPKFEEEIYDRRTYGDAVIAYGLNNAIIEGQSLQDSPYKMLGSRFFEIGWAWRTRVFKNSNALRLHYGLSFHLNGLKQKNNQYFVTNNGVTELEEFEFDLDKSKFRMDNLVFPLHFEFGPSKRIEYKDKIRYSINNKFRFGIGGYAGVNIGARQKLKYQRDGRDVKDKLKGGYETSSFVYGLSAYTGFDRFQLYMKYDLNPIFKNAPVEQRNISLGVRFDLD